MVEFRYLPGYVYVLENSLTQRVKVGMTINDVASRLGAVNDMWLERKVTCQICGGRLVNIMGQVPRHVVSGIGCPGSNAMPLEKDRALAQAYLEKLSSGLDGLSGSEKGSAVRKVKTLERRIEAYRNHAPPDGVWKASVSYYTERAEQVELLSHEVLAERLDKRAPFGEVFCCSVSDAMDAIEAVLSKLGLSESAKKLVAS